MSRLEVPVRYRTLWAEVGLRLKDAQSAWHEEPFRIDRTKDFTTVRT